MSRPRSVQFMRRLSTAVLVVSLLATLNSTNLAEAQQAPVKPVSCTFARGGGTATIAWIAADNDRANRYIVHRKIGNERWKWFDAVAVGEPLTSSSPVSAGIGVKFRIRSRNANATSNFTTCVFGSGVSPKAPTSCSFSRSQGLATIEWVPTNNDQANRYVLERNVNNQGWRWLDFVPAGEPHVATSPVTAGSGVKFRVLTVANTNVRSPYTTCGRNVDNDPNTGDDLDTWDETATWTRFNSTLDLTWANEGGDWLDANGQEQGNVAFSSINLVDDDQPGSIDIDVLSQVISTQEADFYLRRKGGVGFVFASSEVPGRGPVLTINGTTTIEAAADTSLASSTVRALGEEETLRTHGSILIRFDLPAGAPITSAILTLESTGLEYGNQTLEVYQANPTLRTVARPSWLRVDPTEVVTFSGNDVQRDDLPITVQDGIATAQLSAPDLTWISAVKRIPNMTEGCATVYQKLGTDFRPGQGGKHPGFSNTGIGVPGTDVVDGVSYPDTGWGGRRPDGIHWSARTGYGQWNDSHVAARTYFYAMDPSSSYGWIDPFGSPFPKGEWIAYVQCMQLNTVSANLGNHDGKLYYEIAGVGPVYSRENIRWRDNTAPESEMREFWVDYYCGGTSCGDIQDRGTVSFSKVVVTRGLPDMDAVTAEVDRLNDGR